MAAEWLHFDVWGYTSVLTRAIRTLWIALDEMKLLWLDTHKSDGTDPHTLLEASGEAGRVACRSDRATPRSAT